MYGSEGAEMYNTTGVEIGGCFPGTFPDADVCNTFEFVIKNVVNTLF